MENILPFGYTHRQKRSHAQMEGQGQERSASPAWTSSHHTNPPHDANAHGHSLYCPVYQEQRAPRNFHFFARRSSSDPQRLTPTERPASTSALHPATSALHLPRVEGMSSSGPRRFAGDGFDYRRPAGFRQEQAATPVDLSGDDEHTPFDLSGDQGDVIDLTEEDDSGYGQSQDAAGNFDGQNMQQPDFHRYHQAHRAPRLPRGMHAIIDLDSGNEEWRIEPSPPAEAGSPDLEFVSSRPISPRRRHRANSEGDEVEFVRSQALPEDERRRRRDQEMDRALDLMGELRGSFTHLRAQVDRFQARVHQGVERLGGTPPILPPRGASRARGHIHVGFAPPGLMDFEMVGFDLGLEPARAPPPAPQTYTAPDKAPAGFTRSPQEEGELVCPNCEEELCIGDDDVKRQIWIVKGCGHVYCGECTANRSIKKSSKGKEKPSRTRPFKECVVEDCGKKVTNAKSMFQIFL